VLGSNPLWDSNLQMIINELREKIGNGTKVGTKNGTNKNNQNIQNQPIKHFHPQPLINPIRVDIYY
jgi:hypothetical protein